MKHILFFIGLVAVVFACKNGSEKCKFGQPTAIFSADLPHVSSHNFQQKGNESLESLMFDTGIALEIEQSGCEEMQQAFRFTALGDRRSMPDSMWVKEAVRQLVYLSSLGKKQGPLRLWADALEAARPSLKLGETFPIEAGVGVKVDKIVSPDQSVLLLTLSQMQH